MVPTRVPPFPGDILPAAAGAAWVFIAALMLGATAWRALRGRDDDDTPPPFALVTLGLFAQGLGLFALSLAGAVSARNVMLLTGALTVAGAVLGGPALAEAGFATMRRLRELPRQPGLAACALIAIVVLVAAAAAFGTLPTVFYDDLVYHLGLPRQALLWGHMPAWPTNYYTYIPAGWDVLDLVPLSLGGGTGAQLLNAVALAGLAATTHRLAARSAGSAAAWAATALLLVAPMFLALAAFAGNDLFVGLALGCALKRLIASGGKQWMLAGLLAGAAFSAKTVALPAVAALCVAMLFTGDAGWRVRLLRGAGLGITAAVASSPWWLRSWILTGNPVHPALSRLFHDRLWDEVSRRQLETMISHGGGADRGWMALPGSAWDLLTRSDQMGYPSGISALFVVLALLGLLSFKSVRDARPLAAFAVVTWLGWCMSSLNLRYAIALLIALAPFAARVIELGVERLTAFCAPRNLSQVARIAPVAALAAALSVSCTQAIADHARRTAFHGFADREEYAARRIDLVALGRDLDEMLPEDALIMLVGDPRVAAMPRRALASGPHDRPAILDVVRGADGDVARIDGALRAQGVTHVVVNPKEMRRLGECCDFFTRFTPDERALLDAWIAEAAPIARRGECLAFEVGP